MKRLSNFFIAMVCCLSMVEVTNTLALNTTLTNTSIPVVATVQDNSSVGQSAEQKKLAQAVNATLSQAISALFEQKDYREALYALNTFFYEPKYSNWLKVIEHEIGIELLRAKAYLGIAITERDKQKIYVAMTVDAIKEFMDQKDIVMLGENCSSFVFNEDGSIKTVTCEVTNELNSTNVYRFLNELCTSVRENPNKEFVLRIGRSMVVIGKDNIESLPIEEKPDSSKTISDNQEIQAKKNITTVDDASVKTPLPKKRPSFPIIKAVICKGLIIGAVTVAAGGGAAAVLYFYKYRGPASQPTTPPSGDEGPGGGGGGGGRPDFGSPRRSPRVGQPPEEVQQVASPGELPRFCQQGDGSPQAGEPRREEQLAADRERVTGVRNIQVGQLPEEDRLRINLVRLRRIGEQGPPTGHSFPERTWEKASSTTDPKGSS